MRCLTTLLLAAASAAARGGGGGGGRRAAAGSGLALPLGTGIWGGGLRLTVSVSPVLPGGGAAPAQRLELDTGSSTLAFCDSALAKPLEPQKTQYISCNKYGIPGVEETGYWGSFYEGSFQLDGRVNLTGGYSVMQQQSGMPCDEGMQGIFGIAFRQLDKSFRTPAQPVVLFGSGATGCPPAQAAAGVVVPPLVGALRSAGGAEQLGIYWSGELGASTGALYLEGAATSNTHYQQGAMVGQAALAEIGWYDVDILEVGLSSISKAWTGLDCHRAGNCIMDTGTPILLLPEAVHAAVVELQGSGLPLGSLSVTLAGAAGGAPVKLEFDVGRFLQRGWIQAMRGAGAILGLPLWASYYTVFDIAAKAVTFVAPAGTAEAQAGNATATESGGTGGRGGTRRLVGDEPLLV